MNCIKLTFYIVYFPVLASSLRHFKTRYIKCFVNLKFYFFFNGYLLLLSHYFEKITTINVVFKINYLKTSPCKFPMKQYQFSDKKFLCYFKPCNTADSVMCTNAFLFDNFSFPFIIFSWISQHMHEQQRAIGIDTYNFIEVNFMISALMHFKYPLCTSWNETGEQWILYEDFTERQKFWHLWSFDPFGTIRTLCCSFGYFHE